MELTELVKAIVEPLVDNPESIVINEFVENDSILIELGVEKNNIGFVIGREGRTIRSIRTIISAVAAKEKRRVVLQLLE